MGGRLLLVEDDEALAELITYIFEREGFVVDRTPDGDDALLRVTEEAPDIVLLDWMIEGSSGIEVCRQLRRAPKTAGIPIIMLTARGDEADRLRGFETGADDYVSKPFSSKELVARVHAVLRRMRPALVGETLSVGDIEMDTVSFRVRRDGEPVPIGPTEYRLLRHLMQHPQRVFSREQLLDAVWGVDTEVELRTVDVHVRRLRKVLNANDQPDPIRTVRSAGYALDVNLNL